jgi:hypothetical protein
MTARWLPAVLVTLAGCSSPSAPAPPAASAADDGGGNANGGGAGGPADGGTGCMPAAYPSGPYGTSVGATLADLDFAGYVRFAAGSALATTAPWATFSFAELRATCKQYALVHLAAAWCGPCQQSSIGLAQSWSTVKPKGGLLVEVLADGTPSGTAPTRTLLDAWVSQTNTPYTSLIDAPTSPLRALDTLGFDMAYVVDLSTMKILYVQQGGVH